MASTGDDNILNTDEKDLEYRKIQLQKLKEEVVDLEDLREGVSITDLGLNDFRVDLSNYIKSFGELTYIPEGLHTVVKATEILEPGIVAISVPVVFEFFGTQYQHILVPHFIVLDDSQG